MPIVYRLNLKQTGEKKKKERKCRNHVARVERPSKRMDNGVASKGDDRLGCVARALTFEHESLTVSRYLQIINSGESATMNCTVEGYPVESVEWLHDGVPVLTAQDTRIRLLAPLVLVIGSVGRKDKGMYQCLVRSDKENAQATAELKLGGIRCESIIRFLPS